MGNASKKWNHKLLIYSKNFDGDMNYSSDKNYESVTKSSLRYIPAIHEKFERKQIKPLSSYKLTQQNAEVLQETCKSSYQNDFGYKHVDPKVERYSLADPLNSLLFLTDMKTKFFRNPPKPLKSVLSTAKSSYQKYQLSDFIIKKDDVTVSDTYCKILEARRDGQPSCLTEEPGCVKLMDPYLTTTRQYHIPFTSNQWSGIGEKNILTIYDVIEPKIPKCKGFGVKDPPRLGPIFPKKTDPVYDKAKFKFVFPRSNKIVPHTGGISEMKAQYTAPILSSNYYNNKHSNDVEYCEYLPDVSKMQVMTVPGMYESEYVLCFDKKQPSVAVVDQDKRKVQPHKPCLYETQLQ